MEGLNKNNKHTLFISTNLINTILLSYEAISDIVHIKNKSGFQQDIRIYL